MTVIALKTQPAIRRKNQAKNEEMNHNLT